MQLPKAKRARIDDARVACELLWKEFEDAPAAPVELALPPFPADLVLYDWQKGALARILTAFGRDEGDRIGVCAPTATGKSTLAAIVVASIRSADPVLVVAPATLHLQWTADLARFGVPVQPLEIMTPPPLVGVHIVSVEAFAVRPAGPAHWAAIVVDERSSMQFKRAGALADAPTKRFVMLAVEAPTDTHCRILTRMQRSREELYEKSMIFGGNDVTLPNVDYEVCNLSPGALGVPDCYRRLSPANTHGDMKDKQLKLSCYKFAEANRLIRAAVARGEKTLVITPDASWVQVGDWYLARNYQAHALAIKDGVLTADAVYPGGVGKLLAQTRVLSVPHISTRMQADSRISVLHKFLLSDDPVLVAEPGTLNTGLNMQRISNLVFMEPIFERRDENQIIGRLRRPGAHTNLVRVFLLRIAGSFEMAPRLFYDGDSKQRNKRLLDDARWEKAE